MVEQDKEQQIVCRLRQVILQRGSFTLQIDQLNLCRGQLYTLHGENGAGKSTLLQLLALLQLPLQGKYLFQQQPVRWKGSELKQLRRQVTLLEQNPLLFVGTVEQNLAFGLKVRGITGAELRRSIEEALETTGLQGFGSRSVQELSGGEVRRVALARALVLKPQLLLLDEPTANLDVGQVAALERFLTELPMQGMTVVIATHDAEQPVRLGGQVIRLIDGRLERLEPDMDLRGYSPQLRQVKG